MGRKKGSFSEKEIEALQRRMHGNKIYLKRGVLKNEAREKIIAANKNRVWTEEQSKARSERLKGNTNRLGKKYSHSIETRRITRKKKTDIETVNYKETELNKLIPTWLRIHPRIFSEVYR